MDGTSGYDTINSNHCFNFRPSLGGILSTVLRQLYSCLQLKYLTWRGMCVCVCVWKRGGGMGEETVVIIYACVRCSVDMCSGDLQFISRLVRLVKHFMPASVLDPSKVHILHRNSCFILCWVSSLCFVLAHHSPSVYTLYMYMHLPFSFLLFSSPLLSSSLPSPSFSLFLLPSNHPAWLPPRQVLSSCIWWILRERWPTKQIQNNTGTTLFEFQKQSSHSFSLSSQYVPNDYAFMLAKEFPEYFHAIGSVNPHRDDALAELQRCARNGVTIIKWLVSYSSYVNSIQGTR